MTEQTQNSSTVSGKDIDTLDTFAEKSLQAAQPTELLENAPSLIQRGATYLISGALIITLCLLYFGKVHTTVSATGKIVPKGDAVHVRAPFGGVVTELLASVGDRLPADTPLIKLDVSEPGLNAAESQRNLELEESQLLLMRATVTEIERMLSAPGEFLAKDRSVTANSAQLINAFEKTKMRFDDAKQKLERFQERKQLLNREIQLTRENVQLLEKSRKTPSNDFQQELEISNQKLHLAELETKVQFEQTIVDSNYRLAQVNYSQSINNLRSELENLKIQIALVKPAQGKTQSSEHQIAPTTISMPVSGTVTEFKVTNVEGVVSVGTVVATIVPDGTSLVVEAIVANKDIGFVKTDMPARIKIDAYPFQEFGTVGARVVQIFPNSGNEANFTILLSLLEDEITVKGSQIPLFAGLTVQIDLLTNKQRILNLLFAKS